MMDDRDEKQLRSDAQCIAEIMAMLQGVTLKGGQVPTFTKCMDYLSADSKRISDRIQAMRKDAE